MRQQPSRCLWCGRTHKPGSRLIPVHAYYLHEAQQEQREWDEMNREETIESKRDYYLRWVEIVNLRDDPPAYLRQDSLFEAEIADCDDFQLWCFVHFSHSWT